MDKEDEKIQRSKDYQQTFLTPEGKRTLEHLKKLCHYKVVVKPQLGTDGHIDIYQLVRREAQREIITYIETMLARNPEEKKGIKNA